LCIITCERISKKIKRSRRRRRRRRRKKKGRDQTKRGVSRRAKQEGKERRLGRVDHR
jgi:hypothetical protein